MAAINQHFNLTVPASDAAEEEEHSPLYYRLQSAFRDVKLMVDGKKPKKTIEEFLAEFPDDPNEL